MGKLKIYPIYSIFKKIGFVSLAVLFISFLFACHKDTPASYFILQENANNPQDTSGQGSDDVDEIPSDSSIIKNGIDTSGYPDARNFPGLVGEDVDRVEDLQITLDLNYKEVSENMRVVTSPSPLFSTGLYAPAGERVVIDVPSSATGLKVQIGAWTDDLSNESQQNRVAKIYTKEDLEPGTDTIGNLYGGPIYIIATQPIQNPVTFTVTGAVQSPDFVLGETDAGSWWSEVQSTEVPWLNLRSDSVVLTVPSALLVQAGLNDPTDLLTFWGQVVNRDFYEWTGLENDASNAKNQAPLLPFQIVLDKQIAGNADAHAGSPVMVELNSAFINDLKDNKLWDIVGLFGQNEIQPTVWTWDGVKEAAQNIFSVHAAHRLNIDWADLNDGIATNMEDALDYSGDFNSADDFKNASNAATFKLIPFIQIFEKANPLTKNGDNGYDFIPFLYKRARGANDLPSSNQDKRDFFYTALSDFIGQDALPFFEAWGIPVSQNAQDAITAENLDLIDKTLWTYDPIQDTGYNDYNPAPSSSDPYDNSNWEVVAFSAENSDNKGASIIDGDNDTYWEDASGQQPYSITIDMKSKLDVGSFYFVGNQEDMTKTPNMIEISVSENGTDFTPLTSFFLYQSKDKQVRRLSAKQSFQFFKLTIPRKEDIYGSNHVALAEVGVNEDFGGIADEVPYTATNSNPYDRLNWTVHAFSSQETEGEDGHAKNAIDKNQGSWWHTIYNDGDGGNGTGVQYLVIDMHQSLKVTKFHFRQRENTGNPPWTKAKDIAIEVSKDGKTWTEYGQFQLDKEGPDAQVKTNQNQSEEEFRYFKFTSLSRYASDLTSLAEIWVSDDKILPPNADPYDPSNWSIKASSEKKSDGVASDAIDGEADTYWTAHWKPDNGRPDTLTINMNSLLEVGTFHFIQRKNVDHNLNSNLNKIHIEVSKDGYSWDKLGAFDLDVDGGANEQTIPISPRTFQYYRVIIKDNEDVGDDTHGHSTPALAETWVTKDSPYDPSNWSIKASSEKIGDGVASDAIDTDPNSYWTAHWDPDEGRPDTLTIDMKTSLKVNKFYFIQRKNTNLNLNSNLNKIDIDVSTDGDDWEKLGSFNLDVDGGDNTQSIDLTSAKDFRFYKIIILKNEDVGDDTHGHSTPALAETWVGYDPN